VQFQKLRRNLFLTLHGHNVHRQQRRLYKFIKRYQQFASHAYCGAAISKRSELLLAHDKLGQLLLLTVYVVKGEK
jgi:hypothetical protein